MNDCERLVDSPAALPWMKTARRLVREFLGEGKNDVRGQAERVAREFGDPGVAYLLETRLQVLFVKSYAQGLNEADHRKWSTGATTPEAKRG